MDRLKQHIQHHINSMEDIVPEEKVWEKIRERITRKRKTGIVHLLKVAAAACLIVSVCYAVYKAIIHKKEKIRIEKLNTTREQKKKTNKLSIPEQQNKETTNITNTETPDSSATFLDEVLVAKFQPIELRNNGNQIDLYTWNHDKLRIDVPGQSKNQSEQNHEHFGIAIKKIRGKIVIMEDGSTKKIKPSKVVVYIPASSPIHLIDQSGTIRILNDLKALSADLNSSSLTGNTIDTIMLAANYSRIMYKQGSKAYIKGTRIKLMSDRINHLSVDVNYSELSITNADSLSGTSVSSAISASNVRNTVLKMNYGQYAFSRIMNSVKISAYRGAIQIGAFNPDASVIDIEGNFTELYINTSELNNYTFAIHNATKPFELPARVRNSKPAESDSFKRYSTSNAGNKTTFNLRCPGCNIFLK